MNTCESLTDCQRTLVEENLDLVRQTILQSFRYNEGICGLGYDDLYQEGAVALCRAAVTYDNKTRTVPFSAYARTVIRNYLCSHSRRVTLQLKHIPTISLDAPFGEDHSPPEQWLPNTETAEGDWDAQILVDQFLEHGKRTYSGVARLGMEALELKMMGYSGTDIARHYHTRPNHVGAWISRAVKKLKSDDLALRLLEDAPDTKAS